MRFYLHSALLGLIIVCLFTQSTRAQLSLSSSVAHYRTSTTGTVPSVKQTRQHVDSLQRLTQPGYYSALFTAKKRPIGTSQARIAADNCDSFLCNAVSTPTVSLTSSGPLTCTATSVTLIASGNGPTGSTYGFAGPDGVVSSSGNTAVVTKAGDYTVTLSTPGGQSATAVTTVQSSTALTATISGALTVCAGTTTSLSASGGDSFRWNTGETTATISATAGTYSVTATTGSCQATTSVSVSLCIPTNTPPIATVNATQTATVGLAFSYTVSAFTDTETPGSLTYSTSLSPANGLSFDPATRIVSGTPTQQGVVSVTVTATDAGGLSTGTSFSITVQPAPVIPLALTFSASSLTLLTTGSITLSATVSGGSSPYQFAFTGPGSIVANGSTANVSALPAGVQTFTVVVTDAGSPTSQTITGMVSVTVNPANTAPQLANVIPPQSATVGQGFSYSIPANTFTDAQTPAGLTLSVSSLPPGLSFTGPATISGTPSTTVGSPFTVTVTATDPGGLTISTALTIAVQPAPVVVTSLTLSVTASPTTLLTTGTTTLSASVAGGTPPYRYTFRGPGTITPNGSTASISGLTAGVQTFTVTVSDATTPSSQTITRTISVTVNTPAATTSLRVLYLDADNNLTNNAIKPNLQLVNEGTAPMLYGQLTLRYWLTAEQFAPMANLSVYYAQLGTNKVRMNYVALDKPRQGAFGYVEYSFEASAGVLAPGANSGPIQSGIAKQDWTPFNEADDYSYANTRSLTANTRITAYLNGKLVWGSEPAEVPVQRSLKAYTENKSGASTNSISTYLQVRNEGNTAVSYGDLKVRYYLTSEGNQALNFYLDYAVLGNSKIKGQFVRINPPLSKADAYLELSFDGSLGSLSPGSSTGNIQYRIAKQDWSNFNQSTDHSYQNGTNPLAENNRVVVYVAGQRVYGTEPAAGARQAVAESTEALTVQVLGNPTTNAWVDVDIEGAGTEPITVRVIGQHGQLLKQQPIPASTQSIKTRVLLGSEAGTYFLQAVTPTRSTTVKVVRQ